MADRYWVEGTGNWDDENLTFNAIDYDDRRDGDVSNWGAIGLGESQSFTGDGSTLTKVIFHLKKTGSPTGNIVAKIYAHTGTYGTSSKPTGSALATSDNVAISGLTTSLADVEFAFSGANQITLTDSTYYVVSIEYADGDSSNYLSVALDNGGSGHGGNYAGLWSGAPTTWYDDDFYDIFFIICKSTTYIGNHWASSSGGTGGASQPTSADNVIVDENSGFGSGGSIVLTDEKYCNSFTSDTGGHSYNMDGGGGYTLWVYGSLTLESTISFPDDYIFNLTGSNGGNIDMGGITTLYLGISGSGTYTLQSDFEIPTDGTVDLENNVTFDANGYDVTAGGVYFGNCTVYMGSGTWELTGDDVDTGIVFYLDIFGGLSPTIYAETSTLKLTNSSANTKTLLFEEKTLYNVWLAGTGTGTFQIASSGTVNNLKISSPPHTVKLKSGITITSATAFDINGSSGNLITISNLGGIVDGASVLAGGSGYSVDDVCVMYDFTNSIFTGYVTITSVDGSGGVTGFDITDGGYEYTASTAVLLIGGAYDGMLTITSVANPTTRHNFSQGNNLTTYCQYLHLTNSNGTGGVKFVAATSTDNGNNNGWLFPTYYKEISETITGVESLLSSPAKLLTETAMLADTIYNAAAKVLSEIPLIADTIGTAKVTVKQISDAVTVAESYVAGIARILTESLTITESFINSTTVVLGEIFNLSGVMTKLRAATAPVTPETVTITESLATTIARILVETITLTEGFINGARKILTEGLIFVESFLRAIQKNLSDNPTVTETFIKLRAAFISLSETPLVSDTIIKGYRKIISETTSITDSITRRLNGMIVRWAKVAKDIVGWTKTAKDTTDDWTKQDKDF